MSTSAFPHRNLPLLLLQAREALLAHFRPLLAEHGLTEQQWRIVRALVESPAGLEPRQISHQVRISGPSLAGVLARMDELGLVQRERMAHDARRVLVRPTPRARRLATAMAPRIEAIYAALEAQLGGEVLRRSYGAVDELIGRLGELPEAAED